MAGKKWLYAFIPLVIVAVVGYSFYMLNLEKFVDDQNTLVYGQNELASGSAASLRIIALNEKDGEPVANADVKVSARSKETGNQVVLFEGVAEKGSPEISFDVPEDLSGDYELIITTESKAGKDEIIKPISIEKQFKILLATDKPLYQPSQVIHIRTLALQSASSKPAGNEEVIIEVEDSKANKVFKKKLESSEYGIAGVDFTLANEINLGIYTIRASIGDYSVEKKVEVKRYVLPKFKVSVSPDKTYYLPGEILEGTISADYFFGKPTNGAEVNIKIYTYEVNMEMMGDIRGTTDENGNLRFKFLLPDSFVGLPLEKGSSLLFFNVSVTDQAKHTEEITSSVPIAKDPIEIELVPESGELQKGLENIIYIITSYPDGRPAPSTVSIDGKSIRTNSHGIGQFSIKPESFLVDLSASAKDDMGNEGSITVQFPRDYVKNPKTSEEYRRNQRYANDKSRTESVLLRVDKSILNVGDSAHLTVFYTGSRGTVYLDAINDGQTVLTKALDVNDGKASLDLDLDETLAGTVELHAYKILRNSDIVRDTRTIFVNQARDIDLTIEADKDSYLPGEEATIMFSASKNNIGVQSAIGVNIVDEAVFALQERSAGFERLYFELEDELMTPRYEIHDITLPVLISEPVGMDEQVRTQAGNIIMAAAPEEDRFGLKVETKGEKQEQIKDAKESYFSGLFTAVNWTLMLIPLIMLALVIYSHRNEKMKLLANFGISLPMMFGITLLMAGTAIFSSVLREELVVLGWLALIVLAAIVSSVFVSIYGLRKNKLLFNSALLYWLYLALIAAMIFLAFSVETADTDILLWTGLAALLMPIALLIHSVFLMRNKSAIAIPLMIMAALILFVPVLGVGSFGSWSRAGVMDGNLKAMQAEGGIMANIAGAAPARNIVAMGEAIVFEEAESASSEEQPRIRSFFPETLYSNPQVITDENGKASVSLQVADSITSWRITALANTMAGDIGSANKGLVVFQDFFVDIDLPVSLTQGDEVSIPISIYNYLGTPQSVRLEFKQMPWFTLLDEPSKTLIIGANDIDVVYFRIKAAKIGMQELTVFAYGSEKSDAISRIIDIVPDGKEFRSTESDRLDGTAEKTILIPQESIDDSENLFVKIYPGIFSQVVEGLDSLFRMPSGCFEQTSSITYPNLLVLDYMKQTNQINPEIQFKAEEYIGAGYQRLMTFESNTDGGWTWFGPPEEANLMLSAYGLMEFYDMAKVYETDDDIVKRTQDFIKMQMNADGSFNPEGRLHTGGLVVTSKMTSTCFVAWSLGYTEYKSLAQTAGYIEKNIDLTGEDSYTLALCANAMAHYDRQKALPILRELDNRAIKDEKTIHWGAEELQEGTTRTVMGGHGMQKGMETTSIAALAYIDAGYGGSDITKIITYIVNSKDSHGSWGSTFSTIMALKTMIKALGGDSENTEATVRIFVGEELVETIQINNDNGDVMHLVELKEYAKKGNNNVRISMEGKGNLFYQVVCAYYVSWEKVMGIMPAGQDWMTINVNYDKTNLAVNDVVKVSVSAKYNGPGIVNNAIIDLGIPPGFSVISTDLQEYVETGLIEKFDVSGRQLIIYLKNMAEKPVELSYGLKAKYPIKAKTPKSAVYDYYNPDVRDEAEPVEIKVA